MSFFKYCHQIIKIIELSFAKVGIELSLMTLTRKHDNISRLTHMMCKSDRHVTLRDDKIIVSFLFGDTLTHISNNICRRLIETIIFSQNHYITQLLDNVSHLWTFKSISASRRTKQGDDSIIGIDSL